MKVLLTGCESDLFWYAGKVGEIFDVVEHDDKKFILPGGGPECIQKSDCHIIRPTWEVMKEAEETGREVEYWEKFSRKWEYSSASCGSWNTQNIYRLKPEPPTPEYISFEGEELAALVGRVIECEGRVELIYEYDPSKEYPIQTHEECFSAQDLLNKCKFWPEGSPVGKLK